MWNPFSHSRTESELQQPQYPDAAGHEYAVPSLEAGGPYNTAQGWSPVIGASPANFPDPYRLGGQPVRMMRPQGSDTGDSSPFYLSEDADKKARHSVEYQDADGWTETKDYPGYPSAALGFNRFAPNPRATPPPEPRPTTSMAPRSYVFTRPFMQGLPKMGARALSGIHFSMADHRRNYEIYGMEPVKSRRNTYRLNPGPWDSQVVDMPPANDNAPSTQAMTETVPTVEVAYESRNWRLG